MNIYIWEGNGISAAYHDDGTLVVLAESPEQARQIVRDGQAALAAAHTAYRAENAALLAEFDATAGSSRSQFRAWAESRRTLAAPDYYSTHWDGSDAALDREPDRVVATDTPTWVAFNGGGYDG